MQLKKLLERNHKNQPIFHQAVLEIYEDIEDVAKNIPS